MLISSTVRRAAISFILAGLAAYAAIAFYQTRPRQMVGNLLRLDTVPPSLANVQCKSWGATDVLSTCVFDIEPAEFPGLLAGWRFTEGAASGGSYGFSGGPKVGRKFPVTTEYSVTPSEFKNGGRISLVTNKERSRVQLHYYEE